LTSHQDKRTNTAWKANVSIMLTYGSDISNDSPISSLKRGVP